VSGEQAAMLFAEREPAAQERRRSESFMVCYFAPRFRSPVPFWSGSLPETGTLFRGIAKEQSRI
jgi:hypothetical protein